MDNTKKIDHAQGVTSDKGTKSGQPPKKMDPSKPSPKKDGDGGNNDGERKVHNDSPDDQVGRKRQDANNSN